jgi:hypothetical protein
MNHHYKDILSRIPQPPLWWDESSVPRFDPFNPDDISNLYADLCILVDVECQHCWHPFKRAFSFDHAFYADQYRSRSSSDLPIEGRDDIIKLWFPTSRDEDGSIELEWICGDPPNIGCCPGVSSSFITTNVVGVWKRCGSTWESVDVVTDGDVFFVSLESHFQR